MRDPSINSDLTLVSSEETAANEYNSLGQVASTTDQYGGVTSYTYDASGRVIRTQYPNGTETRTVYDSEGRAIWTTNPFVAASSDPASPANGAGATNTVYNALGQVSETDQYAGTVIEILPVTGESGIYASVLVSYGAVLTTTRQYYNSQGEVAESDSPSGLRTGTIYEPDGQVEYTGVLLASASNDAGDAWYNNLPTTVTPSDYFSSYTSYEYDQWDSTLGMLYNAVTDADGHTTRTYTDFEGRTVRTEYADGSFTETLYSEGNSVLAEDQEGESLYDPIYGGLGDESEVVRIAQRKAGDPVVATYDLYDASGRLIYVYEPAVVDGSTSSSTPVVGRWEYEYDVEGNEIEQVDPYYNVTTFSYDEYDDMTGETLPTLVEGYPSTESESWTYDQNGNVLTHVDFDGNTSTYTYYTNYPSTGSGQVGAYAGNVEDVVYTSAPGLDLASQTVTYTYDAFGDQATVNDSVDGITTYSYDPVTGNVASVISPQGTISYIYNNLGELAATYTPDTAIAYAYDPQGQLATVTVKELNGSMLTTPLITTYTYDGVGNEIEEQLSNGVTTTFAYDSLNRLTGETSKHGSTTLYTEVDTYTDDGMKASSIQTQRQTNSATITTTNTWSYDAMDRLTGETLTSSQANSWYTNSYTYDLNSNRALETQVTSAGTDTTTYVYDNDNELIEQDDSVSGTTDFSYDANGSQQGVVPATGAETSYYYDVRNKLIEVQSGSTTATYLYDDAGDRVQETVFSGGVGTMTFYLTDTNNPTGYDQPIEQRPSANGAPSMTYIIGDRVLAQVDNLDDVTYLLVDGHGSTRVFTSASGAVTGTINYDAFGGEVYTSGTTNTIFTFAGEGPFDPVTGLRMPGDGTRDIIEGQSDFIERDIPGPWDDNSNPVTLNAVVYGDGDPVDKNDPTGHYGLDDELEYAGESADLDAEGDGLDAAGENQAEQVVGDAEVAAAEQAVAIDTALGDAAQAVEDVATIAENRSVGLAFQQAVLRTLGLSENFQTYASVIVRNGMALIKNVVPDAVEDAIYEVKNVGYQYLSTQISAMIEQAVLKGIPFILILPTGSTVSQQLQSAVSAVGKIIYMSPP